MKLIKSFKCNVVMGYSYHREMRIMLNGVPSARWIMTDSDGFTAWRYVPEKNCTRQVVRDYFNCVNEHIT